MSDVSSVVEILTSSYACTDLCVNARLSALLGKSNGETTERWVVRVNVAFLLRVRVGLKVCRRVRLVLRSVVALRLLIL